MNSFVSVQILFLFKIIFRDYKYVTSLFSFFPPPHFMHSIPLLSLEFSSARIVVVSCALVLLSDKRIEEEEWICEKLGS